MLAVKKLIIEDIRVPEAMFQNASGGWTRAVAWDDGEMA